MAESMSGIPRGIEVLVKKASVDPGFRKLLLEKRSEAAKEIGLELDPAEAAMLRGVPEAQLEAIIAQTTVSPMTRAAFLGRAAAVMLAALGASVTGADGPPPPGGIKPDRPPVPPDQQGRCILLMETNYRGEASYSVIEESEFARRSAEAMKRNKVLVRAHREATKEWDADEAHADVPFPMKPPQPFACIKHGTYTTKEKADAALKERQKQLDRKAEEAKKVEERRLEGMTEEGRKKDKERAEQLKVAEKLFEEKLKGLVAGQPNPVEPAVTRGIRPDRP
jgi:hypothetical protein